METDTTLICATHHVPFVRGTGDDGSGEWECPVRHGAREADPQIFKPRTRRLPHPWKIVHELDDGAWYENRPAGVKVIVSGCIEADRK